MAVKMNGAHQAQRVTERLSREGIENRTNNAISVHAYNRDSGSLPCRATVRVISPSAIF